MRRLERGGSIMQRSDDTEKRKPWIRLHLPGGPRLPDPDPAAWCEPGFGVMHLRGHPGEIIYILPLTLQGDTPLASCACHRRALVQLLHFGMLGGTARAFKAGAPFTADEVTEVARILRVEPPMIPLFDTCCAADLECAWLGGHGRSNYSEKHSKRREEERLEFLRLFRYSTECQAHDGAHCVA